jgi:putative transposase
MSSYRQLLYHFVFRTKDSLPTIKKDNADQLYAYISGIIKHKDSHLYRINGTENHLHILTDLHPSIAVADFMREIKAASSKWIKEGDLFHSFDGWADGYGSFSCSYKDLGRLIAYVENQREHHSKKKTYEEELRSLLIESGVNIDERFFP